MRAIGQPAFPLDPERSSQSAMALICPVCNTENRDGAHFCRHCGDELAVPADRIPRPPSPEREWATTAPAQLRAPTIPAPLFDPREPAPAPPPARKASAPARSRSRGRPSFFGRLGGSPQDDEQTVFMVHDDEDDLPHPAAARSAFTDSGGTQAAQGERKKAQAKMRRSVSVEPQAPRKRVILLWVGLLAVAVAMIVAGWYGYGTRKAPAVTEDAAPAAAASAASAAPSLAAQPAPAAAPATPVPQQPEPAETATAAASAEAAPAAPLKPTAKPRKQATVAAPAPSAPEPVAPVAAAAPPPPAPAPPPEPAAQCGDRNFIAKAQCMAAQCLKPEYKAHGQCEAVRRQQRLEEEKRNPTLMN
jgi:hypothetical protein